MERILETKKIFTLIFDEDEAKVLLAYVQNPLMEDEPPEFSSLRKKLFYALSSDKEKLKL